VREQGETEAERGEEKLRELRERGAGSWAGRSGELEPDAAARVVRRTGERVSRGRRAVGAQLRGAGGSTARREGTKSELERARAGAWARHG
jgi:hypothetical protein